VDGWCSGEEARVSWELSMGRLGKAHPATQLRLPKTPVLASLSQRPCPPYLHMTHDSLRTKDRCTLALRYHSNIACRADIFT
jgi:hypothetical protein